MKIEEKINAIAFIKQCYLSLLEREPDVIGLQNYLNLFEQKSFKSAVIYMMKDITLSEEYKNIINPGKKSDIHFYFGNRLINGKPVSHIISLGTHCLTATIIKNLGLKKYSTPFDWIFSSPGVVLDCLNDDFALMLDRSQHRSVTHERVRGDNEPGSTHIEFEKRYQTQEMFTHRDITVDENYGYLVRSVNRFKDVLKSDDGKIFLMISRGKHDLRRYYEHISCRLSELTNNFHFVAVQLEHKLNEPLPLSLKLERESDNASLYSFSSRSVEELRGDYSLKSDEAIISSLLIDFKIAI